MMIAVFGYGGGISSTSASFPLGDGTPVEPPKAAARSQATLRSYFF